MSDSDVILKVEGLSKTYFSELKSKRSIKDLFSNPFRKNKGYTSRIEALKEVSFELKKGESLGIIGPNGAGKSTLLKILSGITSPTSGKVTINGRVLSVLDIGTGFHPDLTGRENVYLNGEILGMSRAEIDLKYDEIVGFSGIGEFINRPVKQYSSGMYLRLAFSIVVSLDADLLLFDEVLTVGDFEFKALIKKKIASMITESKSMILVTHDLSELVKNTSKTLVLDNGRVQKIGKTLALANEYALESFDKSEATEATEATGATGATENTKRPTATPENIWVSKSNDKITHRDIDVLSVEIVNSKTLGQPFFMESDLVLKICYKLNVDEAVPLVFQICDLSQSTVFGSIDMKEAHKNLIRGEYSCQINIPGNLLNEGTFLVDLGILDRLDNDETVILRSNVIKFKVLFNKSEEGKVWCQMFPGNIRPILEWSTTKIN